MITEHIKAALATATGWNVLPLRKGLFVPPIDEHSFLRFRLRCL